MEYFLPGRVHEGRIGGPTSPSEVVMAAVIGIALVFSLMALVSWTR